VGAGDRPAAADGMHLVVVASLRTGAGEASQIALVRARLGP
jgi:hypothetical protein